MSTSLPLWAVILEDAEVQEVF